MIFSGHPARAQSNTPRFEVGGQYSLLNFDTFAGYSERRRRESGIGARFTFNFNEYIAAEAQIDYFPHTDLEAIGPFNVPLWGNKTLTVFGVKAGKRAHKFGVFGKARPGFIHFSEAPGFACLAGSIPTFCPQPAKNVFALNFGGVFEYYPSRRFVVRFDAGDTIIYHKRFFPTSHSFQTSAGVGVRF
jgi:hypothetical protein